MFSDVWFEGGAVWRRSSFSQWLIGTALMILAGLLLYALGDSRANTVDHMANADRCLQVAGSDLKLGALAYHDAMARPCGCTATN